MIKNAIGDYKSGLMNINELKTFTQPKYEDGGKAINYIVLAERIVDGVLIARYQTIRNTIFSSIPKERLKFAISNDRYFDKTRRSDR